MINSVVRTVQGVAKTELSLYQEKKNRRKVNGNTSIKRDRNKQKDMPVSAFFNKVVALSENPIVIVDKMLPRDCRTTNGWYSITYNPEGSPKRVKDKPYTIGQDLVRGRFCVSSPAHFKKLCKRIPEFAFLLKWSYFDERLFALAKKHPGIAFPFNFKWAEYGAMIEEKAEKMGIDIDHKPFFAYITKKEKLDQLRAEYKMYPNPVKEDYQSVLDEVDKEVK